MSADNGLVIRIRKGRFYVAEYNASTSSEYPLTDCATLEAAVKFASRYQRDNVVEYGIHFDLRDNE